MAHEEYKNIGSPITRLIEECSELIHILCKADRFGLENYHPDADPSETNMLNIQREMSDVVGAFKDLMRTEKESLKIAKFDSIEKYLKIPDIKSLQSRTDKLVEAVRDEMSFAPSQCICCEENVEIADRAIEDFERGE